MSRDGRFEICYKVNTGGGVEKSTRNGRVCYIYDARKDDWRSGALPRSDIVLPKAGVPRADADTIHRAYSAVLTDPSTALKTANRAGLSARGFPEGLADYLQYRSHPGPKSWKLVESLRAEFSAQVLLTVPGFYPKTLDDGRVSIRFAGRAGLLIPVRDVEGRIVALSNAPDERDGPDSSKYFWISSSGERKGNGPSPGSPVHVPVRSQAPTTVVRITEGQLKADYTQASSKVQTLGCAGVGNYRPAIAAAQSIGAKVARIAFDADWREKSSVARALHDLTRELKAAGIAVEVEVWDPTIR